MAVRSTPLFALACLLAMSISSPAAEIAVLSAENYQSLAPVGKEVDAIHGDYLLRSGEIVAVVAQPTAWRNANLTVRGVAGCVLDLTERAAQNDQLSAFYPEDRQFDYREAEIKSASGDRVLLVLRAAASDSKPEATLTYELEEGNPWITVTSEYVNRGAAPLDVSLRDTVRADTTFAKSPSGASDIWWVDDNYFGQAYAVVSPERKMTADNQGRNLSISYLEGDSEKATIAPGAKVVLVRRLFPAAHRVAAWARARSMRGESNVRLDVAVVDAAGDAVSGASLKITGGGLPEGAARTDEDGAAVLDLVEGEYTLTVEAVGHGPAVEKTVKLDGDAGVEVELSSPGRVAAEVTDAEGEPIACKVEFVGVEGTKSPYFGHQTETFAVHNLRYTPDGRFDQKLNPGEYEVIVSHGSEYDAYFGRLTVSAGAATKLNVALARVVETPGWVSADFHSHASPSGDNTSSQLGRVLNLVAEHIEYAPCTEHNRIDTYLPHFDVLGIHGRMATSSGMELTGSPLPINHQNAFPLKLTPGQQDQGAPQTDNNPVTQISRLALWDARSEKLVQQNHPDLGWMYNDADSDGEPDDGFRGMIQFQDAIEVHYTNRLLRMQPTVGSGDQVRNEVAFNWLQFLNQGIRTPIVHNTDAHYNFHGSGGIRNYVRCSTDDPAQIDTLEIVRECEAGHVVLTNGPYLDVVVASGGRKAIAGDELVAPDGRVTVAVKVQCPNWLDIDRVQILVNGRIHEEYNFTREKNSDGFGDGVVKFDRGIPVEVDSDAHLIVLAVHQSRKVGPVMGPDWGNHEIGACTNPIYLDVDGGGFQPNGDTLGHPLPVASGKAK